MESQEPQRVAMIHDASRDLSAEGIICALEQLDLKPEDKLDLVAILDSFSTPMGYKMRSYATSFIAPREKIVEEELAKKRKEYANSRNIRELSEYFQTKQHGKAATNCISNTVELHVKTIINLAIYCCNHDNILRNLLNRSMESVNEISGKFLLGNDTSQIAFNIEVHAGYAPEVAVNAAQDLSATWLIFNRQMKKKHKYFLDKLPCGILRITSSNSIEKIRVVPKLTGKTTSEEPTHLNYMEIPGCPEEESSHKRPRSLSSEQLVATGDSNVDDSEASIFNHTSAKYRLLNHPKGQKTPFGKHETVEQDSLFYIPQRLEEDQTEVTYKGRPVDEQKQHSSHNETTSELEEFINPMCSVCKNERLKVGAKRDFSYSELHKATKGFSDKNFLSEGGFGSVYKGQLNGMTVAVKLHKNASHQGEKEFKSEVNVLSKARHENVVMLLGSCSEGNTRLLVYEYVCNGSLDQHLSQHSRKPLSWGNRIKIAFGSAKGLLYLHENGIIHRDMRPYNILITHDLQPLLGDFGLARTQDQDSTHSTEVVGAQGYLAPEYLEHGKLSAKTDVYAFGVVLLQIITGMSSTEKRLRGRSLVGWARPLLKERNYLDLIDGRVTTSPDFHQVFWMFRIAEKCLSRDPHKRLNMLAVVNALTRIVEDNTCGVKIRDLHYSSSESSDDSEDEEH